MDGHRSDAVGAQNSAYRFTRPEIFVRPLRAAKHRHEAQALVRGLSKVSTRGEMTSQQT